MTAFLQSLVFAGGDEEDRAPDLRIANATLSQLSYVPTVTKQKYVAGEEVANRLHCKKISRSMVAISMTTG